MACDLERIFGALADAMPEADGNEEVGAITEDDDDDDNDLIIVLNAGNLPRAPAELRTDNLALSWGYHDYGTTPFEMVDFKATKRTFRLLGLLVLSKVFHDGPESVIVHLAMPGMESRAPVRRLVLDYLHNTSGRLGYVRRPDLFRYMPNTEERHPWHGISPEPWSLPILHLTGSHWEMGRMPGPDNRETAIGFGSDEGNVRFAELLLNASMPWNERDEYALESECGFRGVGPGSAEIRLFLPGHVFYDEPVPWP